MIGEQIQKEDIRNYRIIKAPEDHTLELYRKLENALRLGNGFKGKVNIIFQTEEGTKRVETTVWALTEMSLQLKSGIVIPLKSLIDIDY
jgi:hypothetical protein